MTARRLLPTGLRTRVTAVAALAVLLVLTAASVGLVLTQRAALTEALDESLERQAEDLLARLTSGTPVRSSALPSDDVVVEVVDADGSRLAASPEVDGDLLAGVRVPKDGTPVTVEIPSTGEDARLLVRDGDGISVRVAGSLDDVDESAAALTGSLLLVVPVSTAVLALIVWSAVGRALRPVEAMRARVDEISGARLDQRVPEPATADEIRRLARTMNAMLSRLDRSAEQQRQFVADAAHELRNPLARMRTELEVDAAHPASADRAATAASALAETVALQRLVDDLLLLASDDAGQAQHRAVPVDLDEVVHRVVAAAGDPRIDATAVRPVQVAGNRDQLARAVQNLMDNAVRHARSRITVTLAEDRGAAQLTVGDDGPGVPEADAERIFERFTRLDDARAAGTGGAGLGLAIARGIAARHGGSLVLERSESTGARFVLRLPRRPIGGDRV